MSAEDLGRRLLREVEEDGLDQILCSLKAFNYAGVPSYFGIQALDGLLSFHGQAGIAQAPAGRPLLNTSARNAIPKRPFVEITSAGPGQGKTHLLYYMTALAVLPRTHQGVMLHGKGSAVVVLDTDCRFDVQRLAEVMYHYVISQLGPSFSLSQPADGVQSPAARKSKIIYDLVQPSLSHVHMFRPRSHASLLSTISSLPTYLFHSTSHASINRPLHSVILDSVNAFFWQIRADESTARLSNSRVLSTNEVYAGLAQQLADASRTFSCAIVTTSWSLSSYSQTIQGVQSMRPSLPPSWPLTSTLRFGVRRVPIPPFPPATSIENALAEKRRGASALNTGTFEACKLGSESGEPFYFTITKAGVNMEVVREII
ncbi:hypothetical protein AOQ84DRAFT_362106 [Glonium stellatum]|uniref:DNA recombination and repair protein Rad51-like C-terminal domain-containing protein n=1 Tax=Glonium stellatum TaxID=574774 RepID=A0A8E2JV97_9PEZI|nr:hypothetical protein AOQ84DRAFT_362106 [Glonium stellatum]